MKISKLELKRFSKTYLQYIENQSDRESSRYWLDNRNYLEDNGLYHALDIIENMLDRGDDLETIIKVLEILKVEVV